MDRIVPKFLVLIAGILLAHAFLVFSNPIPLSPYMQISAVGSNQALSGMIYTMYHPIASDVNNKTQEGGGVDVDGKPIVTALDVIKSRSSGNSNAGNISNPITLAGDKTHYGEIYYIPEFTFTTVDELGNRTSHTLTNFYGKVTDTGADFKNRPEKIDIATDYASNQRIASIEDGLPSNTGTVELLPVNSQAQDFASSQGTKIASTVAPTTDLTNPLTSAAGKLLGGASSVVRSFTGKKLWMSAPFCYKSLGPAVKGYTAKSATCNGGNVVTPSGVFFLPDCGFMGLACQQPLGCLNLVCAKTPNAIWDPKTGTCGCG